MKQKYKQAASGSAAAGIPAHPSSFLGGGGALSSASSPNPMSIASHPSPLTLPGVSSYPADHNNLLYGTSGSGAADGQRYRQNVHHPGSYDETLLSSGSYHPSTSSSSEAYTHHRSPSSATARLLTANDDEGLLLFGNPGVVAAEDPAFIMSEISRSPLLPSSSKSASAASANYSRSSRSLDYHKWRSRDEDDEDDSALLIGRPHHQYPQHHSQHPVTRELLSQQHQAPSNYLPGGGGSDIGSSTLRDGAMSGSRVRGATSYDGFEPLDRRSAGSAAHPPPSHRQRHHQNPQRQQQQLQESLITRSPPEDGYLI